MREAETKQFTVTAAPDVMARFERLLCMLQTSSAIGHSGRFGMSLDGDGADRFKVKESLRKYRNGAMKVAGVGYGVELATDDGFAGEMIDRDRKTPWHYADSGKYIGEPPPARPKYDIKTEHGRVVG